ncbi:MAG: tetratricopeptide repeat protein [Alphaproteobacteria bacterium]|nr:tetratricopeptide repeat protein [Alphaproteobacteria bacterium]
MADDNNENEKKRRSREYVDRGLAKLPSNNWMGASDDFDKAIELDPNNAEAYYHRGHIVFIEAEETYNDDTYRFALPDFDEAIRLKPDYVEAYNSRGFVKYKLKKYHKAIADFDEAIKRNSDFAPAYNCRGLTRIELKDLQGALTDFDKAIEKNLEYTEAYYNRGKIKRKQGDYKGALADFNQAIKLNPNFEKVYNDRKVVLAIIGEEDFVKRHTYDFREEREELKREIKEGKESIDCQLNFIKILITFLVVIIGYLLICPEGLDIICLGVSDRTCEEVVGSKSPFFHLSLLLIIPLFIFPWVWGLRLKIHARDKDEILLADYYRRAYMKHNLFERFGQEDETIKRLIVSEYIRSWAWNSPAEILLAIKNKQADPSKMHPAEVLGDKLKVKQKPPSGDS